MEDRITLHEDFCSVGFLGDRIIAADGFRRAMDILKIRREKDSIQEIRSWKSALPVATGAD